MGNPFFGFWGPYPRDISLDSPSSHGVQPLGNNLVQSIEIVCLAVIDRPPAPKPFGTAPYPERDGGHKAVKESPCRTEQIILG